MARVPLTRNSVGQFVRTAQLAAGSNVTITESVSGSVLTVTVSASGGGGGGGTPASSVVSETSYGQSPVVGTSTDYARGDHSHGTPAIPAHSALSSLAWSSSGHTGASNAVATWNGGGTATTLQATTDETMLARRGGILQWVAIPIAAVAFTSEAAEVVEYVETFAAAFTADSYPGTIL